MMMEQPSGLQAKIPSHLKKEENEIGVRRVNCDTQSMTTM